MSGYSLEGDAILVPTHAAKDLFQVNVQHLDYLHYHAGLRLRFWRLELSKQFFH